MKPIILFLVYVSLGCFSCKKQKGILDDFDSGKFDFVCITNENGVLDTVTGEVSGPDASSTYYYIYGKTGIKY